MSMPILSPAPPSKGKKTKLEEDVMDPCILVRQLGSEILGHVQQ